MVPMSGAMTVDIDRHFRHESFKRWALARIQRDRAI